MPEMNTVTMANFVIGELHKELPFDLVLEQKQFSEFVRIIDTSSCNIGFAVKNVGDLIHVGMTKDNVDVIDHVLSRYIAQHDQFGMVKNLEVS